MAETRRYELGDEFTGTVLNSIGGKRFAIRCNAIPKPWRVTLHARQPGNLEEGDSVNFWIAKVVPLRSEILGHTGDFGRLPISASMRARYRAGISALLGHRDASAELMGDAKSMLVRAQTQNQADWLTVHRLLGNPTRTELHDLVSRVDRIREARRVAPDTMGGLLDELQTAHGERLNAALVLLGG